MPDQKHAKPLPTPSPDARPYWDHARDHELWLPFCRACQAFFFYPRPFCPTCFGWDIAYRKTSGRGTLYSFAIEYRAFHPGWADETPYVAAIVQLDEGPRLFTTLVDVQPDPDHVRCDMPVEVVFEDVTEDVTLPKFRPAGGDGA